MRQTLFYIPLSEPVVTGVLIVWAIVSLALLVWLVRKQGFSSDTLSYIPLLLVVGAVIYWVLPSLVVEEGPGEAGLPVRGYGVMLLLGMGAGLWLALRRAPRYGLTSDAVYSLAFWMFAGGILGARIFYVTEYWQEFQRDTPGQTLLAVLNVAQGGLVVYGSAIGAALAILLFCWRKHYSPLRLADLATPSMMIGLALGRVGCFLNGCCFGGVCELPWALEFPENSPPHIRQVERGQMWGVQFVGAPADDDAQRSVVIIGSVQPGSPAHDLGLTAGQRVVRIDNLPIRSLHDAARALYGAYSAQRSVTLETNQLTVQLQPLAGTTQHSLAVHPTQLYSAFNAVLLCLLALAYDPLKRRDGEVLALVFTIYPITRFLMEIIRSDEPAVFGTGLTISQNISLCLLAVMALFWVWLLRQPRSPQAASSAQTAPARTASGVPA